MFAGVGSVVANPLLDKYSEYWKGVRENPSDFLTWTYLLSTVEKLVSTFGHRLYQLLNADLPLSCIDMDNSGGDSDNPLVVFVGIIKVNNGLLAVAATNLGVCGYLYFSGRAGKDKRSV